MNRYQRAFIESPGNCLTHYNDKHDELGRFARKWGVWDDDPVERSTEDYYVDADDVYRRREDSGSEEKDPFEERGYTYVYDPNRPRDDEFYTQFGKRIIDRSFGEEGKIAGYDTVGKAFADHIFDPEYDDVREYVDTTFQWAQAREMGEKFVQGLTYAHYDTEKSPEENEENYERTLQKYGPLVVGIGMGARRHPWLEEEYAERGVGRDPDTARNDAARRIADELADEGYIGMRDFKDIGGNAGVETATILFDRKHKMRR